MEHHLDPRMPAPERCVQRYMLDFWARYTLDKVFDEPDGWEVQNMLLVGSLIARSALWREESRGGHYRVDFPRPKKARMHVEV